MAVRQEHHFAVAHGRVGDGAHFRTQQVCLFLAGVSGSYLALMTGTSRGAFSCNRSSAASITGSEWNSSRNTPSKATLATAAIDMPWWWA